MLVNGIYNYGNIAPETLAVAYAIVQSTNGDFKMSVQLAGMVPKQSDSMPAMVGALIGTLQGVDAIPETWTKAIDTLKGICVPHLKGVSIQSVANRLLAKSFAAADGRAHESVTLGRMDGLIGNRGRSQ